MPNNDKKLEEILLADGLAVIPTDTIYGLVGRAFSRPAVERIYALKKRPPKKPFIILIGDISNLEKFGININEKIEKELEKYWPGPTSIILPCPKKELEYLHRGTASLAFRLPDKTDLRELLRRTGPLVAPSANPADLPPAKNIEEAKNYFGDTVDHYLSEGNLEGRPSRLIKIENGRFEVLR